MQSDRTGVPGGERTSPEDVAYRRRVGERIEAIRRQRGMTITELARLTHVSRAHVYQILKGNCTLRITTLNSISKVLGVEDLGSDTMVPVVDSNKSTAKNTIEFEPWESTVIVMLRGVSPQYQKQFVSKLALVYAGLTKSDLEDPDE